MAICTTNSKIAYKHPPTLNSDNSPNDNTVYNASCVTHLSSRCIKITSDKALTFMTSRIVSIIAALATSTLCFCGLANTMNSTMNTFSDVIRHI